VQNRLCKVALKGAGLEAATDLLKGPTTLVWGGETIVDLAKVLTAEARSVKELQIRGGVSGGRRLSKEDIETLSKMPGRLEMLGIVAGTFLGPARRVAAQIMAPARGVAAQIREIEKKAPPADEAPKAEGGAPAAEAPKAEGAAPAVEAPKA
jgi:large subunit ribosomal protein L10